MENQILFVQIYDINNVDVITSDEIISAHGNYALNQIGHGGFRVPATSSITPHLEAANQAWIMTVGLTEPLLRWHIQTIVISNVVQVDTPQGNFIDVSGPGIETLLDFRRTGNNVFDSDVAPVLPAIMSAAPPFVYEVVGAPTAPSRDVYIVSANHSVLNLLRQVQQQTGDSFFIDPIHRKVLWYTAAITQSSGLVFSESEDDMPILTIRRIVNGESPITRLKASGAGTGEDALTLSSAPLAPADKAKLQADFPGIIWGDPLHKSSLEVLGYPIRDEEIKFPYIKPEDDTPEALYKAVFILNQTAGNYFASQSISRVSYEITSVIEHYLVPIGQTARLTYNNEAELNHDQYRVDADLKIQSVSHRIDADGIRYSTILLSNSTAEWLDENQKLVKKIVDLDETSKSTSAPPSGTPSTIPVHHHSLLGLDDNDHPQYLRADGGTPLVGNLVVGGLYTIDGVNISVFKTAYDAHAANAAAHHAPVTPGDGIAVAGQSVSVNGTVVRISRTLTAGDGLTGGGTLEADRAFSLDVPGTLSHAGVNAPAGNHTHEITASSSPGGTASLLKTDGFGELHLSKFRTDAVTSNLIPAQTDTYDLGSSTQLWRKGWLSELDSILFVQNTVQVTGGWWVVPHGSGTLPADVAAADTSIDFSTTLDINDFVLFRSSLQVEYMKITASLGGTSYTVTRNVDGTGANNWPAGQVFVVLGNLGNGRIEFNAQTAGPRMSVITQGTTYNAQTETVRIGDLAGWGGHSGYGIGIGNPTGNRIVYDGASLLVVGDGGSITNINGGNIQTNTITATQIAAGTITTTQLNANAINGMTITGSTVRTAASGARVELNSTRIFGTDGTTTQWEALSSNGQLKAGAGIVTLDSDGISIETAASYAAKNAIKFTTSGSLRAYIWEQESAPRCGLGIQSNGASGKDNQVVILASGVGTKNSTVSLQTNGNATASLNIGTLGATSVSEIKANAGRTFIETGGLTVGWNVYPATGNIVYTGKLEKVYSGTAYTCASPVVIVNKATFANVFYNLTRTSANDGYVTLTGVPAGVTWVFARIVSNPSNSSSWMAAGPQYACDDALIQYTGYGNTQNVFLRTNGTNQLYLRYSGTCWNCSLHIIGYGF